VSSALSSSALGAACGVMADMAFGEPRIDPHPVSAFGQFMGRVESGLYRDRRSAGTLHAFIGAAAGIESGVLLRSTVMATYLSVAHVSLVDAALAVAGALEDEDLPLARQLLPTLVGRDPTGLDAAEISRAVVESLAENTVDAVVAPVLWAVVAGAPGTLGYRAINTMDAMVGHRSERYLRYGWASARLDDAANWVPARLTAALVVLARPRSARAVWQAVRRDAPGHPSPNAGVAEAAFAAALGLRLGGVNVYGSVAERRVSLGGGRPAEIADVRAAVALCRQVNWVLLTLLTLVGVVS
jgi:adenosylcobinamide-phosphate synthase